MTTPSSTRYVVLHWERAGSQPELGADTIFAKLIDADDLARDLNAEAKRDDRTDGYTVHKVSMDVVTY
jgi:hypothetical protein